MCRPILVCNHTRDCNRSYDYRTNQAPLSPITIVLIVACPNGALLSRGLSFSRLHTFSRDEQTRETVRHAGPDRDQGEPHDRVRDHEGVANDRHHPNQDVRGEPDPNNADDERECSKSAASFLPHIRDSEEISGVDW